MTPQEHKNEAEKYLRTVDEQLTIIQSMGRVPVPEAEAALKIVAITTAVAQAHATLATVRP